MADETPKLRIHMIGMDVDPDDLPEGPMVVLTGDLDAVRAAGRLFGEDVLLVLHEVDHG